VLHQIEEAANSRRFVISIHNGAVVDPSSRGAIVIDPKRGTIATGLLANSEQTLAAVRRVDDEVGDSFLQVPLEQRIDEAASKSSLPWQFCFILGGGWKRSKEAADGARIAKSDLILAAIAIIQLASRDAPLGSAPLIEFCRRSLVEVPDPSFAISSLASQRLLVSEGDCRCPHQRFSLVVLGHILEGQDSDGRAAISRMLNAVVADPKFPIAGLRILLHELSFLGEYREWSKLVDVVALEPLIERCASAVSAEDRAFAALLFSDLDSYITDWYKRVRRQFTNTIGEWITNAAPPAGFGLERCMNDLSRRDPITAQEIIKSVDPQKMASALSMTIPETAAHSARLIRAIGWERPNDWQVAFDEKFDREAFIALARDWPSTAPLYAVDQLCSAICSWDEKLALSMIVALTPAVRKAFADDPIAAFKELEKITGHVLRILDPLGAYRGKLAPDKNRLAIGKAMCSALNPEKLATQLSETPRRDFQTATFLLSFLRRVLPSKFMRTVDSIDWARIGESIGRDWVDLTHEEEIFLTVGCAGKKAHAEISAVVVRNFHRIDKLSPRLAAAFPEIVAPFLETGKPLRLGQYNHFEFEFGAMVTIQLARRRSDLVETALSPFEKFAAEALSRENASWFVRAPGFIEVLREVCPAILQRILSFVDVTTAEAGWLDSLKNEKAGSARDAVALLVESSLVRDDTVGDMARRLRKKFPRRSVPRTREHRRRFS
jgi:hypothetical protein